MGVKVERQKEKQKITLIAILLVSSCFLTYYFHEILETGTVFTHFFYIPIILASLWWKRKGLAVAIFLAAFLIFSHYFLRHYAVTANDYLRALMFIVIGFVVTLLSERVAKAQERTAHLNAVLRAIRNVNQLITKEKDRDRLLKGICDNIIETRGYHNAWIALLDENRELVTTAEGGWEKDFLPLIEHMKRGDLPDCSQKALSQSDVVVTKDPPSTCADCPLADKCAEKGAVTIRVEYGGKVYGLLSASILRGFIADEEGHSLFQEVAGDIAFALYSIELEEKQRQAEEKLKEYSGHLEETVEERTKELKEAQGELVRKEKLAILGQLAGGVGHELRNPLGVISNAIYYLKTILSEADDNTREYLGIISSEVCNADKIVSDLLDISRTKSAERQETAVSELVVQALKKQAPPEEIKVSIEIPSDLPPVFIDSRQITQVLVNLFTNACQAMSEGGKLTITAQANKDKVPLCLTDTGCGISKENIKKLFEPLFTTRARGIGLGLTVSRNLVEVNGGMIEVESEEGKGSTFTVILPTK